MKRFSIICLIFLSFSIVCFAQSGRKITPTPTPQVTQATTETGYSESKPIVKSSDRILPTLRGGGTSQKQTQNQTQTNETLSDSEDEVIKVDTSLITIPVSVFDRNGLYIGNLRQENFKIFENGKEQEIAYFGTSDKPFTVVLLLDTSISAQRILPEIKQAARAFVEQLKPQDNVIVMEFDGDVEVLTEATNDRQMIYKAINRANIGSGTALYDAVDFALRKRLRKIEGRKAIILLTDGVDTTSFSSNYNKSVREAEESGVLIFPIHYNTLNDTIDQAGLYGGGSRQEIINAYALGRQYLKDLADNTGGTLFKAAATAAGLNEAFEGIAEELRSQYQIGYYPTEIGKAGDRKQIRVRFNRPNFIIKARDSYIVGATQK